MWEQIDIRIFNFINQDLSSEWLDFILIPIRYETFWIPLYIFIIAFILFNKERYHWVMILSILATVGIADVASSRIIKPTIERPRPCHENSGLETVNLRVRCGSGYSFTSSHATNHFTTAMILFLLFRTRKNKWLGVLFIWAGLISIAQVYVGVHYPVDITCGAILGLLIGYLGYKSHLWLAKKYNLEKTIA